jgi:hypothetical protein
LRQLEPGAGSIQHVADGKRAQQDLAIRRNANESENRKPRKTDFFRSG